MDITMIIATMTERQREAHIEGVEFALDYRLGITDKDKLIYDALTEERTELPNSK